MSFINYETHNRVAYITLNRPDKRNALNPELIAQLTNAFEKAGKDDLVRVVVLKANGNIFSAGADLAYLEQLQSNSFEENLADSALLKDLLLKIYTFPKLVISQVEGHAIAGGCGLASVCDLIFAVPEAKFGYTEVKIGFVAALVACFLIRKVGNARTNELLLSGDLITAETALQYGLINFVEGKEHIRESVKNYAEKLSTGTSAQSVKLTKQIIGIAQNLPLEEALNAAVKLNAEARSTADFKKGINSFLKKENPEW